MTGNSRRVGRAAGGRASPDIATCRHREWSTRNVGRTAKHFQCRVIAINRLLPPVAAPPQGSRIASKALAVRRLFMLEQTANNVNCRGPPVLGRGQLPDAPRGGKHESVG